MTRERMFQHRLALQMGRTVRELKRSMSWAEYDCWRRFDALHPLPDKLADIHHGILMAALVNLTRAQHSVPAIPGDFFVLRDPEPRFDPEAPLPGETEVDRVRRLWEG
jgi:hypothetical protein